MTVSSAPHHAFEIAAQLRVVVVGRFDRIVLPMIAKIEYQQVEFGQQVPPVGIISVGGEAVAVGDEQPNAIGIAVPAHANPGSIVKRNLERLAGGGNFKLHRRAPPKGLFLAIRVGEQRFTGLMETAGFAVNA